jgi:hypothetical protein
MSDYSAERMISAAQVMAIAAELNCRVAGMVAENQFRAHRGEAPAYVEEDFERAHLDTGCYHNYYVDILNRY